MKAAAIQMNSSDQVDSNLFKAESLLTQAKDAGADIVRVSCPDKDSSSWGIQMNY